MTPTSHSNRNALRDGAIAVLPLLLGVAPFGLILGVTAAGSAVGGGLGYATSVIIFGGAAQLATVQLIDGRAAIAVVIATGIVINARHMMYSAAMVPYFREFSPRSRLVLPYLLADQAFAVSTTRYQNENAPSDAGYRRRFFLGAGLSLWTTWQITTIIGVVVGARIPESWSLEFAIPLVFLALLMLAARDRPEVVAAVVGGGTAVVAYNAPYQTGLLIGALAGAAAGVIAERRQR